MSIFYFDITFGCEVDFLVRKIKIKEDFMWIVGQIGTRHIDDTSFVKKHNSYLNFKLIIRIF